ncbi:MAG: ATP-binding cassette domain-containing protein [Acidobacteriota bacterium]
MSATTAIELRGISKSYGEFAAVRNLSFTVMRGSTFGFLGPNGAGKTTTIRMIVNITVPDEGEIEILGARPSPQLQTRIGYLPEERGLYKKMKVRDQLLFFAGLKGVSGVDAASRIQRWGQRLQIAEWLDKKAEELSKGMQQKIQFIATILHEPELLILDEPFSGLDPVNTNLLIEVIQELKQAGRTIIFSTHMMEQVERLCDDICLINKSQKVLGGNLRTVKREFALNKVALCYDGGGDFLHQNGLVKQVDRFANHIELALADGADPQELLRRAIESGARISRFELIEPSLNEIFIAKVGKADEH